MRNKDHLCQLGALPPTVRKRPWPRRETEEGWSGTPARPHVPLVFPPLVRKRLWEAAVEGYELQSRQTLDVRVDLLGLAASHSNLSLDSSYRAVARTFDPFPCARGAVNLTCSVVTPMILIRTTEHRQ